MIPYRVMNQCIFNNHSNINYGLFRYIFYHKPSIASTAQRVIVEHLSSLLCYTERSKVDLIVWVLVERKAECVPVPCVDIVSNEHYQLWMICRAFSGFVNGAVWFLLLLTCFLFVVLIRKHNFVQQIVYVEICICFHSSCTIYFYENVH